MIHRRLVCFMSKSEIIVKHIKNMNERAIRNEQKGICEKSRGDTTRQ